MIKIQATFSGYQGAASTLFSAYDPKTRILSILIEKPYQVERQEDCFVITNVPSIPRDKLFTDADLLPAISAFYALKNGIAADGKTSRLAFGERARRADPEAILAQDGIDTSGPRYRLSPDAHNIQMAALATCHYAARHDTVESTVQMADALMRLSRGEIVTI